MAETSAAAMSQYTNRKLVLHGLLTTRNKEKIAPTPQTASGKGVEFLLIRKSETLFLIFPLLIISISLNSIFNVINLCNLIVLIIIIKEMIVNNLDFADGWLNTHSSPNNLVKDNWKISRPVRQELLISLIIIISSHV